MRVPFQDFFQHLFSIIVLMHVLKTLDLIESRHLYLTIVVTEYA